MRRRGGGREGRERVELPSDVAEELRRITLVEDLGEAVETLLRDLRTYVMGYERGREVLEKIQDMEREFSDEKGWIVFRGKIVRLLSTIYSGVKAGVEEADAAIARMYGAGEPGLEERLRLVESKLRVLDTAENACIETVREIFRYLREALREERRRLVGA